MHRFFYIIFGKKYKFFRGGWKNGKMEEWKDGRMERWKNGKMEEWKDGRMEGWNNGRMEGWKNGRMEGWNNGIMEERINDQQSSFILLNPIQRFPVKISFFLVGGRSYADDFLELG